MTEFSNPRYYRRREKNGFWSLMPLEGPFCSDPVMVNDFTYRVLEHMESGNKLEQILGTLKKSYPEEAEEKLRVDLFHATARLNKHGFVDSGSFVENIQILKNGHRWVRGSIQPCPVGQLPALSQFMAGCVENSRTAWLYSTFVKGLMTECSLEPSRELYDVDRMIEAQVTGGEIFWAYVDEKGQLRGGASSSNYMQMSPVVTITAMAATGGVDEQILGGTQMLSQLIEILKLFGLNEKVRIISCPSVRSSGGNLTILTEGFFSVIAQCLFRKSATFSGEIDGRYKVEYYDCLL